MKEWFEAAGIRAIRTVAQSLLATMGAATVFNELDWKVVASAALLSGVLSLLTSLATGLPEVSEE